MKHAFNFDLVQDMLATASDRRQLNGDYNSNVETYYDDAMNEIGKVEKACGKITKIELINNDPGEPSSFDRFINSPAMQALARDLSQYH